ncbi:hypothetical protein [Bradyrhizobium retamae]|uniref:hypothetical protein n=1 Tax=Bradyrhizobium retamae TaxID=1300035 RepID=UPI000B0505AB|nr:hypothetical protein [Bradyrhizobium retamae]
MSIRRGYWYKAGEAVGGPYKSIGEAKEAASETKATDINIRAVVEIEKRVDGEWHTVH